jgi:hypothetical protein
LEGKINFFFDEESDMLDITIGAPRKAVAKELGIALIRVSERKVTLPS